ncbi:methyltransferase domain-containing protein [Marinihelvus fidelis]|uniref:Methyltransferase domain-containing protein n=1 Tax=Marinihelvus fidelis TaxID=2613842 RepID=A0A5N0TJP5_9GAMM|nr:methyltransferase domain-containing protein [Marinihelvus fidelis]KAA9133549.1 methyltransferase domain-containing protein [Marinihelvus fidelis]
MHASSLDNMQKCYERFAGQVDLAGRERLTVVDIGGSNVNGSYADIFSDPIYDFLAVDLVAGDGVDIVLDDPYVLPFDSGSVDIVISGQAFEHVEFFWKLFEEVARVVRPEGLVFLIVPSAGPVHRFPVDCYRFYPDAMAALARYTGMQLVDCWQDERGPWNDLVGVFSHAFAEEGSDSMAPRPNQHTLALRSASAAPAETNPLNEQTRGEIPYLQAMKTIHEVLSPAGYLEIGVRTGGSMRLAECPAVGVDPAPALSQPLAEGQRLVKQASDVFFEQSGSRVEGIETIDLAFIDGMHLFEYALRDFMNIERRASTNTLVVIDDIYPNTPAQAERVRQTRAWTGDVWRLYVCLKANRPDLCLLPLDTWPTGLLLIAGLNPASRLLWQRYNPLVRSMKGCALDDHPELILGRSDAVHPGNPCVTGLLELLRRRREEGVRFRPGEVRDQLRRR